MKRRESDTVAHEAAMLGYMFAWMLDEIVPREIKSSRVLPMWSGK
jgi:hypothetical protein